MLSPEILLKDECEVQYYGFSTTHFMDDCKYLPKFCFYNEPSEFTVETT